MYRRNKIVISSDWHFTEQCPHWPEKDFIETESVDPTRGDHICVIMHWNQHRRLKRKR